MNVTVNGELLVLEDGTTLIEYLESKQLTESKIAVAIGTRVISRNDWDGVTLQEGDKVMIISAVRGG